MENDNRIYNTPIDVQGLWVDGSPNSGEGVVSEFTCQNLSSKDTVEVDAFKDGVVIISDFLDFTQKTLDGVVITTDTLEFTQKPPPYNVLSKRVDIRVEKYGSIYFLCVASALYARSSGDKEVYALLKRFFVAVDVKFHGLNNDKQINVEALKDYLVHGYNFVMEVVRFEMDYVNRQFQKMKQGEKKYLLVSKTEIKSSEDSPSEVTVTAEVQPLSKDKIRHIALLTRRKFLQEADDVENPLLPSSSSLKLCEPVESAVGEETEEDAVCSVLLQLSDPARASKDPVVASSSSSDNNTSTSSYPPPVTSSSTAPPRTILGKRPVPPSSSSCPSCSSSSNQTLPDDETISSRKRFKAVEEYYDPNQSTSARDELLSDEAVSGIVKVLEVNRKGDEVACVDPSEVFQHSSSSLAGDNSDDASSESHSSAPRPLPNKPDAVAGVVQVVAASQSATQGHHLSVFKKSVWNSDNIGTPPAATTDRLFGPLVESMTPMTATAAPTLGDLLRSHFSLDTARMRPADQEAVRIIGDTVSSQNSVLQRGPSLLSTSTTTTATVPAPCVATQATPAGGYRSSEGSGCVSAEDSKSGDDESSSGNNGGRLSVDLSSSSSSSSFAVVQRRKRLKIKKDPVDGERQVYWPKGVYPTEQGTYRVQLNLQGAVKKFSRNVPKLDQAVWLYETIILMSDSPSDIKTMMENGNYETLIQRKIIDDSNTYYKEFGKQIILLGFHGVLKPTEFDRAVGCYDKLTPVNGQSLIDRNKSLLNDKNEADAAATLGSSTSSDLNLDGIVFKIEESSTSSAPVLSNIAGPANRSYSVLLPQSIADSSSAAKHMNTNRMHSANQKRPYTTLATPDSQLITSFKAPMYPRQESRLFSPANRCWSSGVHTMRASQLTQFFHHSKVRLQYKSRWQVGSLTYTNPDYGLCTVHCVDGNILHSVSFCQLEAITEQEFIHTVYVHRNFGRCMDAITADAAVDPAIFAKLDAAVLNCQDKYGETILMRAVQKRIIWLIRLSVPLSQIETTDDHGFTALAHCCATTSLVFSKDVTTLLLLLAAGASITHRDYMGRTPLMHAARCGNDSMITVLRERGANLHDRDYAGLTALLHAIRKGRDLTATSLILFGANPHDIDYRNQNALTHAGLAYSRQLISVLLQLGIDIGNLSEDGSSILHYASANDDEETAVRFVHLGINPFATNYRLLTAFDLCTTKRVHDAILVAWSRRMFLVLSVVERCQPNIFQRIFTTNKPAWNHISTFL